MDHNLNFQIVFIVLSFRPHVKWTKWSIHATTRTLVWLRTETQEPLIVTLTDQVRLSQLAIKVWRKWWSYRRSRTRANESTMWRTIGTTGRRSSGQTVRRRLQSLRLGFVVSSLWQHECEGYVCDGEPVVVRTGVSLHHKKQTNVRNQWMNEVHCYHFDCWQLLRNWVVIHTAWTTTVLWRKIYFYHQCNMRLPSTSSDKHIENDLLDFNSLL